MRKSLSIALGVLAAAGAAVVATVCLAILEIYLAGHGHGTVMDHIVIGDPDSATRLSMADLIALAISAAIGAGATWLTWPAAHRRAG
jgi:hypothetical protein